MNARPIFLDDDTVRDPITGEIRPLILPSAPVVADAPAIDAPMVEWALFYARHEWPVFPSDGKRPLTPRDKDANGEEIKRTGGFYKATTNEDQIRAWWKKWPDAQIAIRAGEASGVFAIDIDAEAGLENWAKIIAEHGDTPQTHAHLTPGGGKHLVFRWHADRPITISPGQLKSTPSTAPG